MPWINRASSLSSHPYRGAEMKIALVTHYAIKGDGQGRFNCELVKYVARRGHEVHLYVNKADGDLVKQKGVFYHHIPVLFQRPVLLRSLIFLLLATARLKRTKHDIVHLNGAVSLAGYDINTCHFCHSAWADLQHELRLEKGLYRAIATKIQAWLERRVYREERGGIVAVSRKIADELRQNAGVVKEIFTVYNGIDPSEFDPSARDACRKWLGQEFDLEETDFVLLFAGDIRTRSKGLHFLLMSLQEDQVDKRVKLLIAGDTKRSPFVREVQVNGLSDRVRFIGFRKDLHRVLAGADTFVLPTTYDSFSMVLLEAMACGTPVIVSSPKYCGAAELIRHMENGIILQNQADPAEIREKIELLRKDADLRRSMGVQARRTAEQHTWTAVGEAYERLYGDVLASKAVDRRTTRVLSGTGGKPKIGVIYGYSMKYATSIQTRYLAMRLKEHFVIREIVPWFSESCLIENAARATVNLVAPLSPFFDPDVMLYGNDGVVSVDILNLLKRRPTVVIWYDCFNDVASKPPRPWSPKAYIRYRNIREAGAVITGSDKLYEMACRIRGSEKGVFYMPVGVETSLFDPSRYDGSEVRRLYGVPDGAILIGYLGRIAGKGDNFAGRPLAEAASEVVKAAGDRVKFMVIGFGPALKRFQDFVSRRGLREKFIFTGYIKEREEIPKYLAACDICVATLDDLFLSYARSETKVKEYLAMGKAVIATAIGENIKDLDGGRAGLLVEPGSRNLAKSLLELVENSDLRRCLGECARQRAVEVYDWKILSKTVEEILRFVLGGSAP